MGSPLACCSLILFLFLVCKAKSYLSSGALFSEHNLNVFDDLRQYFHCDFDKFFGELLEPDLYWV